MHQHSSNALEKIRFASAQDFPAQQLLGLQSNIQTGENAHDSIDLIEEAFGKTVPQGSLFAYLFRRFGNPNIPSDDYKDLASYLLKTTDDNILLRITPYAGGDSSISVRFMISGDLNALAHQWLIKDRTAHESAFIAWVEESNLLPEWTDAFFAKAQEKGWLHSHPEPKARAAALFSTMHWAEWSAKREKSQDDNVTWAQNIRAAYHEINPQPAHQYRDPDWQKWLSDDPLKAVAATIFETMHELTRPVWVRDVPINPWGQMTDDAAADWHGGDIEDIESPVAKSAGYNSGVLSNADPELFATIQARIYRMGMGDPVAGMKKLLENLPEDIETHCN